jgi:hypothetical protein
MDLMRYHGVILRIYSNAAHGFSDPDDNNALIEFMANYKGPKNMTPPFYGTIRPKIIKGYHSEDIALYSTIKKKVLEERHHVLTIVSELDDDAKTITMANDGFPTNCFKVRPFTFHYPSHKAKAFIKEECDDNAASKKWKLCAPPLDNVLQFAMELDDDDHFKYPAVMPHSI